MNEQIQSIIKDIEDICIDDTIDRFYIGKTADVNDRECEHSNNGYTNFSEIAKGVPDAINKAEKELVSHFLKSPLKSTFDNENNGGRGNPEADTLYIVFVRKNIQDPNEPNGSLMPSNYPINLK